MAGFPGLVSQPSLTLGLFLDDYSSFRITRKPLLSPPVQQRTKKQHGQPELEEGFYLAVSSLSWNLRAMLLTAVYAVTAIGAIWLLIFSNHVMLRLLAGWAIIELAWGNFMAYRYHVLNQLTKEVPSEETIARTEERFLSLKDYIDIKEFIAGWFGYVDPHVLGRGNIEDFVAYGFHNKSIHQVDQQLHNRIQNWLDRAQELWDVTCACGQDRCSCRNPSISFMAHLWEDLRVLHKPLAVHLLSEAGALFTHAWLRLHGFRKFRHQADTYWIKPAENHLSDVNLPAGPTHQHPPHGCIHTRGDSVTSVPDRASSGLRAEAESRVGSAGPNLRTELGAAASAETPSEATRPTAGPRPIVFLHGVGFGLLPYLMLLKTVMRGNPGHPVIVTEVRHVSLRLCMEAAPVDATAHLIAAILQRHGFPDACIVGHSFGTFCASRMCQLYRPMVHSLVLMDPVCLMTCHPQLLANFIYKSPILADLANPHKLLESLRALISRDLIVAQAFCRKFLWQELMLWPEDMPESVLCCISADDDLVPAGPVVKQLQAAGKTVLFHPTAVHGTVLLDFAFQADIVAEMRDMLTHDVRKNEGKKQQ